MSVVKKKSATLSEKINKLFEPDHVKDQSDESGDDTAPKFSEFDEAPDEGVKNAALSEFRKRNIKFLEDIDRKYKGTVSSRKEAFEANSENSDNDGATDEDDYEEDDNSDGGNDDEEYEDEGSSDGSDRDSRAKRTSIVLKPPTYDEDSEASDDGDAADESGADDDDESTGEPNESFSEYFGSNKQQSSNEQITLIKQENQQETVSKGLAVQSQLKLWERMLEMRIKLQPCLITANSLPPGDAFETFRAGSAEFREKAEQTSKTVAEALDRFLALQETLLGQFSETSQLLKSGSKRKLSTKNPSHSKRIGLDEYERFLGNRSADMMEYRNGVLMKWHDRTKIASSVRNQKQSQTVLKKIEDSLINRDELVRKTQLYRGGYTLFTRPEVSQSKRTHPEEEEELATEVDPERDAMQPVYDSEIYDDSDFYHQLLRELIEYKTNTTESPQEIANKLTELQKLRNKMKKDVDTRASKGRKIRYVVHNKLVNYMAPVPDYEWTDEAKDELFGSLFGRTPTSDDR